MLTTDRGFSSIQRLIISQRCRQFEKTDRVLSTGSGRIYLSSSFKRCAYLLLVIISLISVPAQVSAYDGLSDLIEDVFRGLTGQKKKPQALQEIVRPVQQFPPPPEAELKKRKDRLIGYATAGKKWLASECDLAGHALSEEQDRELDQIFLKEVESSQERYKNGNNQRNRHGFPDFAPVKFTFNGAAALNFTGTAWDRSIEKILTPKQVEILDKAQSRRTEFLLEAQRAWVLNLLDQELYFTSQQREVVQEHLTKRITSANAQLYSLSNQNYYLQYQQPHTLLKTLPKDALSESQKARLDRVSKGNVNGPASERYITFMSNDGVDSWYDTLEKAIEEQGQRLRGMADLQIQYYQEEFDLDQAGIDHLKLAAKGTALYCLADWKESTTRNLRQWEERMQQQQFGNGNFGFSISVPNANIIEQHQLWKNAVKALAFDTSKISTERSERRRLMESKYLLSLLDHELWLTEQQREQFAQLLTKKMPENQISGYEYMYEIVLLSIPMVVMNDNEVKKIFAASLAKDDKNNDDLPQMNAWESLKGQYQINGRQVTMQMQNMGQFSFNIPK